MDAESVNKSVRQALTARGFTGVLPVNKAQTIIDEVTAHYVATAFKVTVEMSPIHNVGKPISCDCGRSVIRVEPRYRSASKNH
jgi:hypothetical protein